MKDSVILSFVYSSNTPRARDCDHEGLIIGAVMMKAKRHLHRSSATAGPVMVMRDPGRSNRSFVESRFRCLENIQVRF